MTIVSESLDLIDVAKSLAPVIEAHREESERQRTLPKPVVQAMMEAGLFRMWLPKALGGLETDIVTFLRVVEEVSKLDGAAGWSVMIGGSAGMFAAYLPEDAAREIFTRDGIGAGAINPKGRATPADGGYQLTGRWPLASGCMHATVLGGGSFVFEGDAPRMNGALPDLRIMVLPKSDAEIIDTWDSAGLRGSGSHDFAVNDIFVPEGRTFSVLDGKPYQDGVLYRASILSWFSMIVCAVSLGIARDAIDTFVELAGGKTPVFSAALLREKTTVQAAVGEAEAMLRSVRSFVLETAASAWETVGAGDPLSEEQETLMRLAPAYAAQRSARAVDMVYTLGGATSVYTTSRLERCLRDAHVVTQHISSSQAWYERTGQYFLGMGLGSFG